MLKALGIERYQSLGDLRLDLGKFTLITGPTGSGKTAVIRALQLLAFNAPGTGYVQYGQRDCQVALAWQGEDGLPRAVNITRAVTRGHDKYVYISPDRDAAGQLRGESIAEFTKLAGKVPAAVAEVLQLGKLNFSSQFDAPFLLSESGAEVARVLGRLTNVTLILSAAREGARRRQRLADRLKDKEAEIERLRGEAARFAGLAERRSAVREAEEAWTRLQQLEARAQRLQQLSGQLSAAQATLASVREVPEPPDLSVAEAMAERLHRFKSVWAGVLVAHGEMVRAEQDDVRAELEIRQAEHDFHQLLRDAGTCPTCGQAIPYRGAIGGRPAQEG
jgi:DNA repair protein SbcC/Rad50